MYGDMPRGDMPDGSFSEAEMARLVAEGIIEVHQPGTPEWEEHAGAMLDQRDAFDARLLAEEGPDALASDRRLRLSALAAERDPETVGYAFAAWCQERCWERADLAAYLSLTMEMYALLAHEPRSADGLAEVFGVDPARLAAVLAG